MLAGLIVGCLGIVWYIILAEEGHQGYMGFLGGVVGFVFGLIGLITGHICYKQHIKQNKTGAILTVIIGIIVWIAYIIILISLLNSL